MYPLSLYVYLTHQTGTIWKHHAEYEVNVILFLGSSLRYV